MKVFFEFQTKIFDFQILTHCCTVARKLCRRKFPRVMGSSFEMREKQSLNRRVSRGKKIAERFLQPGRCLAKRSSFGFCCLSNPAGKKGFSAGSSSSGCCPRKPAHKAVSRVALKIVNRFRTVLMNTIGTPANKTQKEVVDKPQKFRTDNFPTNLSVKFFSQLQRNDNRFVVLTAQRVLCWTGARSNHSVVRIEKLPRHTYVGHGGEGQAGSAVRTLCLSVGQAAVRWHRVVLTSSIVNAQRLPGSSSGSLLVLEVVGCGL
jgi:hypothetical protein